ncbi:hypothetical protein DNTS_022116 [Danionella cerebrum]|uniref:Uncharacterized protein n=1 Tax=Danionella cerebrum TaxID=2873325 RepID=A0A553R0K4_9TELE|nr:hypothetical protein DNTS_022116 [Danionella translucida]
MWVQSEKNQSSPSGHDVLQEPDQERLESSVTSAAEDAGGEELLLGIKDLLSAGNRKDRFMCFSPSSSSRNILLLLIKAPL